MGHKILNLLILLMVWGSLMPNHAALATIVAQPPPTNLLINSGFEEGNYAPTATPMGWTTEAATRSTAIFTWDSTVARSGRKSVKIDLTALNDARWVQSVALQPNTDYEFSGWIKTQGIPFMNQVVDAGANLSTSGAFLLPASHGVYGTSNWTYVSLTFNSGERSWLSLFARIGYYAGTTVGTAWFDDLQLVQISRTTDPHSMLWNGSFEEGSFFAPYATPYGWMMGRQGQQYITWEEEAAYFGAHSVKIDCPNYCASLYEQSVAVQPNTNYLLSGWIKTAGVSHTNGVVDVGANLNIAGLWTYTRPLFGTNDWTYVSLLFNSGDRTQVYVHARMGYDSGGSRGVAWYDGLQLRPLGANMLINPGFALGTNPWTFFTTGKGSFTTPQKDSSGDSAARIEILKKGADTRFYQTNLFLEPRTRYRLQFAAYSNTGRDFNIYLDQDLTDTSYGLRNYRPNLTKRWKTYVIEFTTKNFTTPVVDGRLRFLLGKLAQSGDIYWIDNISLKKIQGVNAADAAPLSGGSIAGTVQGSTTPVKVTVMDLETEGAVYQATTTTDSSGDFHFVQLPAGAFVLTAEAPPGYLAPTPVVFTSADELTDLELVLEAVTTTIYLPQITQ